jgi:hypothetical protein
MFKKLKLLLIYIRILKKNEILLKQQHNISIDWVWRMYKTYVIPIDELDNVKEYGFKYVNTLVQKEMVKIDKTFIKIGLSEYVGLMEAVDLTEREIGLAFRFKYLDTSKMFNKFIWSLITIIGGGIGFLFGSFLGLGIGLISVFVLYLFTRIFV